MSAYSDLILAEPSLLHYWRLEEESFPMPNEGPGVVQFPAPLSGTITCGVPSPVVGGGVCLEWGASTGVIRINPDLAAEEHTAELWVRLAAVPDVAIGVLQGGYDRSDAGGISQQWIFQIQEDGDWRVGYGTRSTPGQEITGQFSEVPGAPIGRPVHLVVVSGATEWRAYVNGQVIAALGSWIPLPLAQLGVQMPAAGSRVDEIAIYDGELDAGRIAAHYRAGSSQEYWGSPI